MAASTTTEASQRYPDSLLVPDIRVLIGFTLARSANPGRRLRGAGDGPMIARGPQHASARVTGGQPRRRAFFEFEPFDGVRQIYTAHEERGRITHVEGVEGFAPPITIKTPDGTVLPLPFMHPVTPPLVCAVRVFETADRCPLVILIDEARDRVVLAIGNIGHRIEWTPNAPSGHRPTWYSQITVLS